MNVTGWNELISGNLISAAFIMFDTAFGGWVVVILFMVYQFMLYMKTRNAALSWITGVLFTAMFAASTIMSASGVPVREPAAATNRQHRRVNPDARHDCRRRPGSHHRPHCAVAGWRLRLARPSLAAFVQGAYRDPSHAGADGGPAGYPVTSSL